ncbi:protein dj-1beta-like [Phlebotomus argentipes]|uniref:protein dj-1beta-like n=1 Tax=Phlebotomus argentipes TaxID=94469 RepID=UPI0028933FF4|nr:protein dj-1beta-like [Phlebotomus argentipes]
MSSIVSRSTLRVFPRNSLSGQLLINLRRMSKSALVILAPGAEEMEFVIAADVLRRAEVKVTVAGLGSAGPIKCSRDVVAVPDVSLADVAGQEFDAVVLPGGLGGAKALSESAEVGKVLKRHEESNKLIAAICAGPTALVAHKIGVGKSITSYPSVKDKVTEDYKYVDDKTCVQDGQLITSRGPGTAFEWALKIAENLAGPEKTQAVKKGMLL